MILYYIKINSIGYLPKMLSKTINYGFRVTRKAKFYKKPILSGIPDYHKPNFVDIHDTYQNRPKD